MDIYEARKLQKEISSHCSVRDKYNNIISFVHQFSAFDDNNNLIYSVALEIKQGLGLVINDKTIDHFNSALSMDISIMIQASKQNTDIIYIIYIIRID